MGLWAEAKLQETVATCLSFKGMACPDREETALIQEGSGLAGREKDSTAGDSDSSF